VFDEQRANSRSSSRHLPRGSKAAQRRVGSDVQSRGGRDAGPEGRAVRTPWNVLPRAGARQSGDAAWSMRVPRRGLRAVAPAAGKAAGRGAGDLLLWGFGSFDAGASCELLPRESGGIGRRTSLRGWRTQVRGGSSPPFRTNSRFARSGAQGGHQPSPIGPAGLGLHGRVPPFAPTSKL
jgi:hypothetical protein